MVRRSQGVIVVYYQNLKDKVLNSDDLNQLNEMVEDIPYRPFIAIGEISLLKDLPAEIRSQLVAVFCLNYVPHALKAWLTLINRERKPGSKVEDIRVETEIIETDQDFRFSPDTLNAFANALVKLSKNRENS